MLKKIIWSISFALTGIFIFLSGMHVYKVHHFNELSSSRFGEIVYTKQDFLTYLGNYFKRNPLTSGESVYYVPTGIFIESFRFISGNTVNLSGYVWQKYTPSLLKIINPGIVFPEATEMKSNQAYKIEKDGITIIGWYFEGKFTENFNYKKYPLDKKIIALRIWPSDFKPNVILIPDFNAYLSTLPNTKFGIDPEIVSQGYSLVSTFFSYKLTSYDTDFGLSKNAVGREGYLEFYYNLDVKRNVINAMITHLLPLFVIIIFSFILLNNVSAKTEPGVLTCCASFLFIILLSHIKLREDLAGGGIVYIEYIYFILYFSSLYLLLASLLGIQRKTINGKSVLISHTNLYFFLKTIFLPLIFGAVFLITILVL